MGQKTKTGGRGRLDKYYHLAKEQGYRSRAAFKLIQLNRKYDFLSNCRALLDLCAAPGGWMQVAAKTMPVGSLIIGVDLVPIKPVRGTKTVLGDITTQECRAKIRKEAGGSMMDVVVHDGAPNVGGAWSSEAYTQSALVLDSLKLATELLAPNGTFVTKIFRSQDYNALLYAMQQLFDKVDPTKPAASRNTSAEIFVVCTGYKAPAKIDPKLLDAKTLFQEVTEVKHSIGPEALFKAKVAQKRNREGYEDGVTSLHKESSGLSFVASERPVEVLGNFTRLVLEGPTSWEAPGVADAKELAHRVRTHASTTPEIVQLCKDLQVLGRSEFKQLLKWRLDIRKSLKEELGPVGGLSGGAAPKPKLEKAGVAARTGAEAEADATPADPEAAMLAEMRAVQTRMAADEKREKRKRREMKVKARVRSAQLAATEGIAGDAGVDGLFTLGVLRGKDSLNKVVDVSAPGEQDMEALEMSSNSEDDTGPANNSDMDEDEADLQYEAELEAGLEESYRSYMERQGYRAAAAKEKRKRLGMEGELEEDVSGAGTTGDADEQAPGKLVRRAGYGLDSDQGGSSEDEGDGLLVSLDARRAGVAKTGAAMAAQWFQQDLFNDPNLVDGEGAAAGPDDNEDGPTVQQSKHLHKAKAGAKAAEAAEAAASPSAEADEPQPMVSNSDIGWETPLAGHGGPAGSAAGAGFEVVPIGKAVKRAGTDGTVAAAVKSDAASGSDTDSDDEFDLLDDHGKAEVLALAKRMLRRRDKESIIDAAYNRFAFHDTHLPRWFTEDEHRHMRPIPTVTKEEIEAEKERLRAIDARPIKKVAEAKARRRKVTMAKLQTARAKANSIVDSDEVPGSSKQREIEKIYAKTRSSIAKGGKNGKKTKGGGKNKPLDPRMRKELRATKRIAKEGKGRGRKGVGSRGAKGKGGGKGKKGAASNRKSRD